MTPRQVDPDYASEAAAAADAGFEIALVDFEALAQSGDAERAVRRVPARSEPTLAVFRGWMLTPDAYDALYRALADRGWRLINDPDAYRTCHHLPESSPRLAEHTPRSVWLPLRADETPQL